MVKGRKRKPKAAMPPPRHSERPTPERRQRGDWQLFETEDAGVKHERDVTAHPIDALEWRGVLSSDQASAARDYEALYRAQCEILGARDSTTIWEPRGFQSDDGPLRAKEEYKELCKSIGLLRESRLQWIIVHGRPIRHADVGLLREDLNELARFFKK